MSVPMFLTQLRRGGGREGGKGVGIRGLRGDPGSLFDFIWVDVFTLGILVFSIR